LILTFCQPAFFGSFCMEKTYTARLTIVNNDFATIK